ncbi:MAG TPA: ABC transporter ATP-binding protein [Candidatus Saccharimonadales bacterium]|nr:ABC transporter ATP-binding protein [Candidatus Saccharimonadales bacterium]
MKDNQHRLDSSEPVLVAQGLTKRYDSVTALDHLDLSIQSGEVLGYLGPNGAGKTTTIRLLLGLIRPTAGSAQIFGLDTQKERVAAHRRIAYVPGEAALWPSLTGIETLHLLGKIHGRIDSRYQVELIRRFRFDPHKKVRTYSKGNRQKINLIAALSTRAELLIMDEPTSGLDPIMEQAFRTSVLEAKDRGQTVFLSSHVLEEVEALCDRLAILRAGKLVELGTLEQMRHLSAVTVQATFAGPPPKVGRIKGVSHVQVTGHQLTCQVQGPIAELLSILSAARPRTLLSREPSLEELFLSIYGDKDVRRFGSR